ncbi:hypothetical protein [Jannaschia aquimarina]|uniref:RplU_2 protein n=1 Tax=Jannaschia aquimarina TaxID=935700 RepID=A0A0D1EJ61_9RHOB|nr:hypothetical protein [Jannaschia aquimarina]KIT15815.1 50S ribosomal protein L21 [Jannaschia aquimarina]SNT09254.1 Predicted 5' DNA nuclease, flap endonuclease-1-like, helix-3-turn-helix (H3TH) domain [Jannaschia aquimarina]
MQQEIRPVGTLESTAICFGVAALAGFGAMVMLYLLADWTPLQAIFSGGAIGTILAVLLIATIGRPQPAPTLMTGQMEMPTESRSKATSPGQPGEPAMPEPMGPRDLSAPSPHRNEIPGSIISSTDTLEPHPIAKILETPKVEAVPATRIPSPAPINAADPAVARPVGVTSDPRPMGQPAPLNGKVVSPEPPVAPPFAAGAASSAPAANRNEAAPGGGDAPAPTASAAAQSYNETDPMPDAVARTSEPAGVAPKSSGSSAAAAAAGEAQEEQKPVTLDAPKDGKADDLKMIKGVGPKLEKLCNELGFYHFAQIAAWTPAEVAWVDRHLEGFKGRVSRDDWVAQAKLLADGGETEFSKKVGDGGVY